MQCPATLARALTGSASIAGLIITAVIRTMVARAIITAMDLIRTTATTRAGRILIGVTQLLGGIHTRTQAVIRTAVTAITILTTRQLTATTDHWLPPFNDASVNSATTTV